MCISTNTFELCHINILIKNFDSVAKAVTMQIRLYTYFEEKITLELYEVFRNASFV